MATFKRYLMFQAMMFVFGIVGPIFLILYFASQPDPMVRWAYWAGLFITAADILIALWLTGTTGDKKTPNDVKVAVALQNRIQSGRGGDSGSSSSSSSSDLFFGGAAAAVFVSSDSGSSSDSGWFSNDSGSSSSESGSSSGDSGSSSSDSGSSSSSSD